MGFFRFIAFSVVRAWQGFWRNAMMSLATTATVVLMLVLLSGLYIVISGLNSGLEFIESKVGVTAQLVDNLPQASLERLISDAQQLPGVKAVNYVSPAEAMERLKAVYRARGQELNLGDQTLQKISIYASLEIQLADPKAADSVATALADRPRWSRSRPSRTRSTSWWGSSTSFAPSASWP